VRLVRSYRNTKERDEDLYGSGPLVVDSPDNKDSDDDTSPVSSERNIELKIPEINQTENRAPETPRNNESRNPEIPKNPENRAPENPRNIENSRNPEIIPKNPESRNPDIIIRNNPDIVTPELLSIKDNYTDVGALQELLRKREEENDNLKKQIIALQKAKAQPHSHVTQPVSPPKQIYNIKRDQVWHLIEEDDAHTIETLNRSSEIDLTKPYSSPAFHYAISMGSTDTLKVLAKSCPKSGLNEPDAAGHTPLLYAIERGPKDRVETIVQILIKNKANVELGDVSENGFSPLHAACHSGNHRLVGMLLNAGADPHKCDNRLGWSSIHWGVAGGSSAIIKLLLEKGVVLQRINGLTPAQLATDLHHQHLLALLRTK